MAGLLVLLVALAVTHGLLLREWSRGLQRPVVMRVINVPVRVRKAA